MARGRKSSSLRTIQVFRAAKRGSKRGGKRGFAKKFGGGLLNIVEHSLGRGQLYKGVAAKILGPGVSPLAQIYGEYSAGGLEGLAINEFLVEPFIGLPQALPNILGPGGLNLSNLFGMSQQGGPMGPMAPQVVG